MIDRRYSPRRLARGIARRARAARDRVSGCIEPTLEQLRLGLTPGTPEHVVVRLRLRNLFTRRSVLGDGPVVSLTTHGARLATVHLAIESIAAGTLKPSQLRLWLDDEDEWRRLTPQLRRLRRRGLTVGLSENYGPHTKYYPFLAATDVIAGPLVTADDDILYPPFWLERLAAAFAADPVDVHCYRAHRIRFAGEVLAPYSRWGRCTSTEPSVLHFLTGVSGVLYPPYVLEAIRAQGLAFVDCAPRADDVWLHSRAVQAGARIRQVGPVAVHFPMIPTSQESRLMVENALLGANDEQIACAYDDGLMATLRAARSTAPPDVDPETTW